MGKFYKGNDNKGKYMDTSYAFAHPPMIGGDNVDRVNSPSHYTQGKVEAIEIIEDAIKDAPSVEAGYNQGQVLKYLLRAWLKDNPLEDLKKARWYLNRLIDSLE